MATNLARAATFLRDLADIAKRTLESELSLSPDRSAEVAALIARATCNEHRGENIYVPTSRDLEIDERDEALYSAYCASNKNVQLVAKRFSLSEKQVYERVRIYQATAFAQAQGTLDLDDP